MTRQLRHNLGPRCSFRRSHVTLLGFLDERRHLGYDQYSKCESQWAGTLSQSFHESLAKITRSSSVTEALCLSGYTLSFNPSEDHDEGSNASSCSTVRPRSIPLVITAAPQWLALGIQRGVGMSFSAAYSDPRAKVAFHWTPLHWVLARTSFTHETTHPYHHASDPSHGVASGPFAY